jgi:hypothetical protein
MNQIILLPPHQTHKGVKTLSVTKVMQLKKEKIAKFSIIA